MCTEYVDRSHNYEWQHKLNWGAAGETIGICVKMFKWSWTKQTNRQTSVRQTNKQANKQNKMMDSFFFFNYPYLILRFSIYSYTENWFRVCLPALPNIIIPRDYCFLWYYYESLTSTRLPFNFSLVGCFCLSLVFLFRCFISFFFFLFFDSKECEQFLSLRRLK